MKGESYSEVLSFLFIELKELLLRRCPHRISLLSFLVQDLLVPFSRLFVVTLETILSSSFNVVNIIEVASSNARELTIES